MPGGLGPLGMPTGTERGMRYPDEQDYAGPEQLNHDCVTAHDWSAQFAPA
jgi:hypothetical protein